MHTVSLSLGSNLGDRPASLQQAVSTLQTYLHDSQLSPIYETEPVPHDLHQPWFLNQCMQGRTLLSAKALLNVIQSIENDMGRQRPYPNSPRVIDIDIIFFDSIIVDTPILCLPHPCYAERRFVLQPLCDLIPSFRCPRVGVMLQTLLLQLNDTSHVTPYRPESDSTNRPR